MSQPAMKAELLHFQIISRLLISVSGYCSDLRKAKKLYDIEWINKLIFKNKWEENGTKLHITVDPTLVLHKY